MFNLFKQVLMLCCGKSKEDEGRQWRVEKGESKMENRVIGGRKKRGWEPEGEERGRERVYRMASVLEMREG